MHHRLFPTGSCILFRYYLTGAWNLVDVCNGLLAGLVAVTAPCSVIEPWAAIICGFVGAFVFIGASVLLVKLKIDDPLEAAPMHGFCGAWGCLYVGFMAAPHYVAQAYNAGADYGVFYGGEGKLLACQIIGIVCIFLWVTLMLFPFFFILQKLDMLRVPASVEMLGLDVSKHGGHAYYGDDSSKAAAEYEKDNFKQTTPQI